MLYSALSQRISGGDASLRCNCAENNEITGFF
jgi:hypothetical protein